MNNKIEAFLIKSYKNLVGYSDEKDKPMPSKQDKKSIQELKPQLEEAEKLNINQYEIKIRKALEEIESSQNIYLNKNILGETSLLYKRNKINIYLYL